MQSLMIEDQMQKFWLLVYVNYKYWYYWKLSHLDCGSTIKLIWKVYILYLTKSQSYIQYSVTFHQNTLNIHKVPLFKWCFKCMQKWKLPRGLMIFQACSNLLLFEPLFKWGLSSRFFLIIQIVTKNCTFFVGKIWNRLQIVKSQSLLYWLRCVLATKSILNDLI